MNPAQPAAQPRSPWVTVGIIALILLVLCICVAIAIPVILALLGPAIGGVFSNILTSLPPTPTP